MIHCHICGEKDNPVKETERNCVGCGNPARDPKSRWFGWTKAELVAKIEHLEFQRDEYLKLDTYIESERNLDRDPETI